MTTIKTRNVLSVALFAALLMIAMPSTVMATSHNNDQNNFQQLDSDRFATVDEDGNKIVTAEILGWLQLQAHDLFFVERGNRIDASSATEFENGKLDLSTLLIDMTTGEPFSDEQIANGGEARNSENIMLFTIASNLGQKYLEVRDAEGEESALDTIMHIYKGWIKRTYQATFDERLPAPQEGDVTDTENLAYRTLHDLLSDQIFVDRHIVSTLDSSLAGKTLDRLERTQFASPLDGQFDEGFLHIEVAPGIEVSLLDADSTFATQFGTDFPFEFFLVELEDGHYDTNDEVLKQIRSLIAKGQNF